MSLCEAAAGCLIGASFGALGVAVASLASTRVGVPFPAGVDTSGRGAPTGSALGLLNATCSLALGVGGIYLVQRHELRGKRLLRAAAVAALPGSIVVFAATGIVLRALGLGEGIDFDW